MQIGKINDFYRIYLEDYVYTYIKQLEQTDSSKRIKIYLFGRQEHQQNEINFYIYGAADSEKGVLSIQHDFFSQFEILGIMHIYKEEKEITLQNGITFQANGFFVFYEQNLAMQSFLIYTYQENVKQKNEESNKKIDVKERLVHKNVSNKEKKTIAGNRALYAATYSMAIVVCIIAITAINRYDKLQGFNNDFLEAANMEDVLVSEYSVEESFYIEETHELESIEEELSTDLWEETLQTPEEEPSTMETEQSVEQPTEAYTEYEIMQGDSLAKICRKIYGDETKLKEICNINQIEDPDHIKQGQKILLP